MKKLRNTSDKSEPSSKKAYIVTEPFDRIHQFGVVDTCNIFLKLNGNKIRESSIENIRPCKIDPETAEVISYTGTIKKLRITWSTEYLWITGSMAKSYRGNNLNLLTIAQLKQVTTELSRKLKIDLMKGRIRRLDISFNIPTALPAKSYFPFFETKPRMNRNDSGANTLYFTNRHKQIAIYDKKLELWQKHRIKIKDDQLTRFELRLFTPGIKSRMLNKYGKPFLTIADLLERNIFSGLVRLIQNEYDAIVKKQSHYFVLSLCKKPNDIVGMLALNGIEHFGGLNEVLLVLENSKAFCSLPYPEFISRLKGIVRKIAGHKNFTTKFDEIDKLDVQVRMITRYSLMWFDVL